ncbi:MAG: hypothetical protein DRJ51_06445 [Thermoprotei archaeon]|nr:MAG: hypothetical protein DRJ51_06445 [Thermoprotei archaeon]
MENEVICLGEIILDFIPVNHNTYKACFGGAPMNTAVACARLGLRTGAIAAVGNDAFGRFLLATLRERNVDVSHVKVISDARTTLAIVVKLPEGEREFFFYRKPWCRTADTEIVFTEEDIEYISRARLLHISGFALSQDPARTSIMKAVEHIKASGNVKISFDPTFRPDVWPDLNSAREVYSKVIDFVDILLATAKEYSVLFGVETPREILKELGEKVDVIGVKMGVKGAVLSCSGESYYMPAYKVEVRDTVGAGDAWNAAIMYGLLKKWATDETLSLANAVAAIKCMHVGAISGLPSSSEAIEFRKKFPDIKPEPLS